MDSSLLLLSKTSVSPSCSSMKREVSRVHLVLSISRMKFLAVLSISVLTQNEIRRKKNSSTLFLTQPQNMLFFDSIKLKQNFIFGEGCFVLFSVPCAYLHIRVMDDFVSQESQYTLSK